MEAEMKLPASMSETDIIDFINSRNMERRDLNQGQRKNSPRRRRPHHGAEHRDQHRQGDDRDDHG
jgi:hypothetical protein